MNRRSFLLKCLISMGMAGSVGKWLTLKAAGSTSFSNKDYYRIVVLGDPHLPVRERENKSLEKRQRIMAAKYGVLADINTWEDVDQVTVLGDIAAQFAVAAEYEYAKEYFARLKKPLYLIGGNHDYVYEDAFSPAGKFVLGDAACRKQKLARFKEIFKLDSLYYTKEAGAYRLIYLSPDSLGRHLAEMSETETAWFTEQLAAHQDKPTIVFFHAPLKDTLLTYNKTVNTPDFVAQPVTEVARVLEANSQVRLWVSGHTHTPATNESYASAQINTYEGHVTNVHTPDMDRETIWTNSLYLYADKIVIRTFNHSSKTWEEGLDRTISLSGG